jgi:hypothetical protein
MSHYSAYTMQLHGGKTAAGTCWSGAHNQSIADVLSAVHLQAARSVRPELNISELVMPDA